MSARARKRPPSVVITGASQGIGAAVAACFAREVQGVRLALLARNANNLRKIATACRRLGAEADVVPCDASDEASVAAAAHTVLGAGGAPDVLVNNAGRFAGASFLEITTEAFDSLVRDNLRSVFLVSKAFVPAMAKRGSGHVFNMSSIAGLQAYPAGAGYCAAKFGVTGLSAVMRRELRENGVQVTTVFPGATWTPSWAGSGFGPERMMPAESIAKAIVDAWRLGPAAVVEDIVLRPPGGDL
ncbi:SDR family oxidoreductase [Opitutales bacterium ASA1]|uniref:SDR family oxidoreductase n=1 Tax=Congregicoccus parvus TaxID=3081749 RepID=UPI002B2A7636|nr:SDR family oxidoreductase [Opitutales bacterium ASA1]